MMPKMQCNESTSVMQCNGAKNAVQCNEVFWYQTSWHGHLLLNKVLACCLILQEEDLKMRIEIILKQEAALFNKCCLSDFNFTAIS